MANDIILVIFGSQWTSATPIASILAISLMPTYLTAFAPNLLAATGNVNRRLKVAMWYSPIHILVVLIASTRGLETVAMAWAVSNAVVVILYTVEIKRLLRCTILDLYGPSISSGILAGASFVAQSVALTVSRQLFDHIAFRLGIVAIAGGVAWLIAGKLLNNFAYVELVKTIIKARNTVLK